MAGPSTHARLGPSGAYIWTICTASPNESDGQPNEGNDASRIGTACHGVSSECLVHGTQPVEFLGREFLFCKDPSGHRHENLRELIGDISGMAVEHIVGITDDYVGYCDAYVNFVRELVATTGAEMLVEQRVPIGHLTGEEGAGGTSDVILFYGRTIHIVDAKFGRNRVLAYEVVKPALPDPISGEVQPPVLGPNRQLAMYAGGAIEEHRLFREFDTVKMTIVQPPLNHVSEFTMSVEALEAFLRDEIVAKAEATRTNPQHVAGDHCTYCKGREKCKARDAYVISTALEGFTDASDPVQVAQARPMTVQPSLLGVYYERIGTIKQWCEDIVARMYQAVQAGEHVIGASGEPYKLVVGKKGDRYWKNPDEIEKTLKETMRLRDDEMYSKKLISPAAAEKLSKAPKGQAPRIGKTQWNRLSEQIGQEDGKPTLAPASDPRPAIEPAVAGFGDCNEFQPESTSVDLFS